MGSGDLQAIFDLIFVGLMAVSFFMGALKGGQR
jgi:hypothetical protein